MKIIETINNALDTVQSIEGILREARTYAAEARDTRLEIENRRLLDQNWSLVEERDAAIAKREALQVEIATLRAKSEPVASGIGEPDYGVGFEKCAKEEATEVCLNTGGRWGAWLDPSLLSFGLKCNDYRFRRPITKPEPVASDVGEPNPGEGFELCEKSEATHACHLDCGTTWNNWRLKGTWVFDCPGEDYRFRRPIAKPAVKTEPQWVACTAEEALSNQDVSEWLNSGKAWMSCAPPCINDGKLSEAYAYRTTAQLSEWVTVSAEIRNELAGTATDRRVTAHGGGWEYQLLRSTAPVGTVLG